MAKAKVQISGSEEVKVVQIVAGAPNKVYGLGEDGLMYRWNNVLAEWELWKVVPQSNPQPTQSKS